MINGSLSGSKVAVNNRGNYLTTFGNNSQNTLNIRGFNKVCFLWCWDVHVASFESYTLPSFNSEEIITRFKKGLTNKRTKSPNLN